MANPKNITASTMEDNYVDMLNEIRIEPQMLDMAKKIVTMIWQQNVDNLNKGKRADESEIKAIERQIDEYINLIPSAKSESIRTRYEAKIEELDQKVKELGKTIEIKNEPNLEEALNLTLRLLGTPGETWRNAVGEHKTMVHNMIFTENPKYSVKTGFGTPSLSLPFTIKHYAYGTNLELVEVAGLAPASKTADSAVLHA